MGNEELASAMRFQSSARGNEWPLDFFIHAVTVDTFLGACSEAAGLPGRTPSASRWASSVWPPRLQSAGEVRKLAKVVSTRTAWATLLSDDVSDGRSFQRWLDAFLVLRWSLSKLHSGVVRPLIVICDQLRTPAPLLITLREQGM